MSNQGLIPCEIRTGRLLLRRWCLEDVEPFAALNADTAVAEFLGGALTHAQSAALATRIQQHFAEHGFGLWALELIDGAAFIGCTGLSTPQFMAPFMPCVEVAWRLSPRFWGHGYATEAARAALCFAFDHLQLPEVLSFTTRANHRSRAVMERLGMRHSPAEDFDHPGLPPGHALRPHLLYRITEPQLARQE